jgi:putative glutamine amidotransferase
MGPLVGITCGLTSDCYTVTKYYSQAVEKCGGLPVILPTTTNKSTLEALNKKISGLILSGGGDLDPTYFGEEPAIGLGRITPERDYYELELAKLFLAAHKPILGICRGMQVLNIAAGGTIWQDIHTQLYSPVLKHNQEAPKWYPTHRVLVTAHTLLSFVLGEVDEVRVNSFHHQGINKVAKGFRINAIANDGIIEGIESLEDKFILGIQWHPECMWENEPIQLALFQEFINACKDKTL